MRRFLVVITFVLPLIALHTVQAGYMSPISDLISTSVPSSAANHIVTFTVRNAVPASGTITITPEDAFSIPGGFDFTDVDVAVSNGGPYAEHNLAALPSASEDGVTVVSGASGSITIALSSGSGIAANESVRVILGTNATHQVVGDVSPVNPALPGSYRVRVNTANGATPIDDAKAMFVVVTPITLTTVVTDNAPQVLNALPTGTIPAGSAMVELSFQTNVMATCKYATSSGITYASMPNTFSAVGQQLHYGVVSGLADGGTYSYYIRCRDTFGATAQSDYVHTFSLATTPTVTTSDGNTPGVASTGAGGAGGSGGAGSFAGGSSLLFQSTVKISGFAPANSSVTILKDGTQQANVLAGSSGAFSTTISALERGTYSFVSFATDARARKSSRFSSTLTLNAGTVNGITGVLLSPTISPDSESVALAESVRVSGVGVPGTIVHLIVRDVPASGTAGVAKEYTASTSLENAAGTGGVWEFTIPAKDLKRGTYDIKVKTVTPSASSEYSAPVYVGVGEAPSRQVDNDNRSDINKDGKVNLVDFSILLTHWNEDDPDADINEDNTVNLADFSILLFNWTG